jgi:outer membrane lipoprotein SlyB
MTNKMCGSLAAGLLAALALQGCVYTNSSPNVYEGAQTQREQVVRMATVESVRAVRINTNNGQTTGLGAVGGGVLGAVAGSAIGNGRGSVVTAIVGGIGGAIAGNAIESGVAVRDGFEITVRLDNGELRAITQQATGELFQAGDRVRLLSGDGVTRVTH